MPAAIAAVREGFLALAEGRVDQPQRLVSTDGSALSMMARVEPSQDTVVKTVTVSPDNQRRGLPTVHAVVLFFQGATGQPRALIDGTAVTAVRTGAASGVATDLLARRDAGLLAVVGCGGQARDQIEAVCTVRSIREIRLASRNHTSCHAFARRLQAEKPAIRVTSHESPREAVAGAHVICCATTSVTPLFAHSDLTADVHINAIGAYTASMCELGPDVLRSARLVVVDQLDAALEEAGDVIQALEDGAIAPNDLHELGSLVSSGTTNQDGGVTVFKSVGIAVQDWTVAKLAYERAMGLPGQRYVRFASARA